MKVKIYALINTIDNTPFYIGCTNQQLKARLSGHVNYKFRSTKKTFIDNILINGGKVEIIELDEVDFENGSFWEQFYIDLFFSFGYKLIQRRIANYNECKPLNRKRGKTYWAKGRSSKKVNELNTAIA